MLQILDTSLITLKDCQDMRVCLQKLDTLRGKKHTREEANYSETEHLHETQPHQTNKEGNVLVQKSDFLRELFKANDKETKDKNKL
jgi:hypothetical protein